MREPGTVYIFPDAASAVRRASGKMYTVPDCIRTRVMPAKAGIHAESVWTPAFAGVTASAGATVAYA